MKYTFRFTVRPGSKPHTAQLPGETIEGVLPVSDEDEMRDFMGMFRGLLVDYTPRRLKPRKPPKGMVAIKKAKASGEEGE